MISQGTVDSGYIYSRVGYGERIGKQKKVLVNRQSSIRTYIENINTEIDKLQLKTG